MKSNIHPTWYDDATVTCSCGNTFTTGSTKKEIKVDLCSACHPFYTGEMKFVDVQGRVEKFQAKWKKAQEYQANNKSMKQVTKKQTEAKSLKEMMQDLKTRQRKTETPAAAAKKIAFPPYVWIPHPFSRVF